jgi:hypothetical protein
VDVINVTAFSGRGWGFRVQTHDDYRHLVITVPRVEHESPDEIGVFMDHQQLRVLRDTIDRALAANSGDGEP